MISHDSPQKIAQSRAKKSGASRVSLKVQQNLRPAGVSGPGVVVEPPAWPMRKHQKGINFWRIPEIGVPKNG